MPSSPLCYLRLDCDPCWLLDFLPSLATGTSGRCQCFLTLLYCCRGICMRSGVREGSSQPSKDSISACGIAVHPTVGCPGPRQMCMKMHEPRTATTGSVLCSTTTPQRYSSSERSICSELCQSGETVPRSTTLL